WSASSSRRSYSDSRPDARSRRASTAAISRIDTSCGCTDDAELAAALTDDGRTRRRCAASGDGALDGDGAPAGDTPAGDAPATIATPRPGTAGARMAISRILPAAAGGAAGLAGASMSQPEAGSTGWTTRCGWPPSVTTRLSTATYAVNRHSTPNRSDVSTRP